MARWCASQGAQVTVADTRDQPPGLQVLQQAWPAVRCLRGAFTADLLQQSAARAVFRSPGLAPDEIAPAFDAARSIGLWLGGELDLFLRALAELRESRAYAPRILAVTGTNGKTTVTALTGQLLERAGRRVAVAGNIGPTLLDTLSEALARDDLPEDWVLELSSFQLDGVTGFEPTAATLLNLSQDHLDWHGSLQAYAAAKARVFGQQGLMVLNRDDAAVLAMCPPPPAVRTRGPRTPQRPWCSFGSDLPGRPGDFGLEEVNGMVWLVRAHNDDAPGNSRRGETPEIHLQRLMPADALRLRGRHNALNALAALALG
ncbi:MAG: UDP-N-acetylmuramoyl-L-alanine--D-glutamate ligase, partial [Rhodoferax sp.]|nr:UDP-N-acetylmuramoyl-L-alanine--D-glutamate ligase [Rhodoferax sp.]